MKQNRPVALEIDSSRIAAHEIYLVSAALVSMTVAIAGASTDRALARTSFDGPWTVLVIPQRGACGSGG
jgi:hypothetical protein